MSDLREQVRPYLRDDIDSVEITIPQGLVRKLLEVSMLQKARIEELEKEVKRLEDRWSGATWNITGLGGIRDD